MILAICMQCPLLTVKNEVLLIHLLGCRIRRLHEVPLRVFKRCINTPLKVIQTHYSANEIS